MGEEGGLFEWHVMMGRTKELAFRIALPLLREERNVEVSKMKWHDADVFSGERPVKCCWQAIAFAHAKMIDLRGSGIDLDQVGVAFRVQDEIKAHHT